MSDQRPVVPRISWRGLLVESFGTILLTLAMLGIISSFFSLKVVHGESMYPVLAKGDFVLAARQLPREYKKGFMVLFSGADGYDLVKRVVAVAGDNISCRENVLYVNYSPVPGYCQDDENEPHPYVNDVVPAEHVFVVGDNHEASSDSRAWGPLPLSRVYGQVIAVVWPLERIGFVAFRSAEGR